MKNVGIVMEGSTKKIGTKIVSQFPLCARSYHVGTLRFGLKNTSHLKQEKLQILLFFFNQIE